METITAEEARKRLENLRGWALDGGALRRQFTFGSFADAVGFVVRLAFAAEAADHHPDIVINYRRVTLTYTTHSAGGLTEKDFDGAGEAGRLAEAGGSGT
jgi:4a-hydroxytetrahydrobiopterin dehydratase